MTGQLSIRSAGFTPVMPRGLAMVAVALMVSVITACATRDIGHTATTQTPPIPTIVTQNGRHAFFVDGEPFLILGAQTNNSANYPAALPDVWPVVEKMHANTLGIPVAWEQIEPQEGQFDFSYVDTLIEQARERDIKLVLLWFATWKNNAPHYAPAWVKLDNERFPRVVKKDGDTLNSLSPHFRSTLEADKKAFVELIKHIQSVDKQRNVILVQVQNEVGTYGAARDYSDTAQAIFESEVPERLLRDMDKPAGTWREVFGNDADEFFHAWHIARYVDEIAAAGKAVYPIPMNVNVALRNPFNPGKPGQYSSGGPTDNVIPVWQSAAPHIDMISPDIYFRDYKTVDKVLDLYSRPDNPLFVAEIGNAQPFARYFFATMGHQGIGFAPFGMDNTDYANYPLGARALNENVIGHFAEIYKLMAPWAGKWAELSFNNPVWGFSEPSDPSEESRKIWNAEASPQEAKEARGEYYTQHADLGRWDVAVSYGRPMFWIDPPAGNDPSSGGVIITRLGDDEYLVAGYRARVTFKGSSEIAGEKTMIERVEEGHFEKGEWVFERVWNGDQTDWGLNLTSRPHILKVKMATYKTR